MSVIAASYARIVSLAEFNEKKSALRQSEGALLRSDLRALKRSLGLFVRNCDELLVE